MPSGPTGGCTIHHRPSQDAWQQSETVIQALTIASGLRVADRGADEGSFTWPLAEAVGPEGWIYVVDVNETALRLLDRQRTQHGGADVKLIRAWPTDARLPETGGGPDL